MNDDFAVTGGIVVPALRLFAIQTHELFMELQNAGFNEEQSIKILVGLANKE